MDSRHNSSVVFLVRDICPPGGSVPVIAGTKSAWTRWRLEQPCRSSLVGPGRQLYWVEMPTRDETPAGFQEEEEGRRRKGCRAGDGRSVNSEIAHGLLFHMDYRLNDNIF